MSDFAPTCEEYLVKNGCSKGHCKACWPEPKGPKGPTIDGQEFPSPADLRWKGSSPGTYQMEDLYVYKNSTASFARIEVRGLRVGTVSEADKYFAQIREAFAERKRIEDERVKRAALAYVANLVSNPRI